MSVIDEIKARIDIVDLVSETVQLRRSGKNYTGFCPFHANVRTPAFALFPESGTWRCFGQCNEGGDIFKFVMKKEGWDFSEALRFLAERAGIQLKPPTPQEQAIAEEHDHLRTLLENAVTFYRHQLLNTAPGQSALQYLHQRGLNDETIEAFGLGYAPAGGEVQVSYFKSRGAREKDLLESGLVSQRDAGGIYDRFRHRIMFPIRDERGRMAGFGARILNPDDVPKFLNSPQTPIFDKGHLLYGLDRARKTIRTLDQAVIVEGYLDVIALHQTGFTNAVSPMGTALTAQQLTLLKRFTRRIIMALDPDVAGDKATLRGLQIARETLDREAEPVFDARGLLGFEARLQADIRVTTLPPGMDPDDIVNRDPKEWEQIIQNARPIVIHVMETLAAARGVDDPKVKSEIAAQVLPLIEDVVDPVERDAYRQRLARLLRIDERVLTGETAARSSRPGRSRFQPARSRTKAVAPVAATPAYTLDIHCLGLLLRRPDLVYRVDRELQKHGLARLSNADFEQADYQVIYQLIQDSLEQDISEPVNFVLNNLPLDLMEKADELLVRTEKIDMNEERILEDLLRTILEIRRRDSHQAIDYLRFLMEDAQQQGDLLAMEYQQSILQYAVTLKRLHQAIGQYTNRSAVAN